MHLEHVYFYFHGVETCPESEGIATLFCATNTLFRSFLVETCPESEGIATRHIIHVIHVMHLVGVETCPESEGIATYPRPAPYLPCIQPL